MHIIDNILTVNETEIILPRLSVDTKVRVWSVPTEYRANGYFVSVMTPGQPPEIPACKPTAYLGEIEYPADNEEMLRDAKQRKHFNINTLRDAKIAAGVTYAFPDGITGTVQTRDLTDHRNIQANGSAAQMYIIAGQPQAEMQFRDMEDVMHMLTAQQMVEMCFYIMGHGQAIYSAGWAHKDAIDRLETIEAVQAYDETQGWPV